MNEIKIYLKQSGSTAELYKDFNLYKGCYMNAQISVYVPKTLLYHATDLTNAVKIGAILTAQNGEKITTDSYFLNYVSDELYHGVEYSVYTRNLPKEFTLEAGSQTVVANVVSIDNSDAVSPRIISVTTTQTAQLIVYESAYLEKDETIDPSDLEVIGGEINSLAERTTENENQIKEIRENFSKAIVVWGFNTPADVSDLDWQLLK